MIMTGDEKSDGFMSRWSRRKLDVEAAEAADAEELTAAMAATEPAAEAPDEPTEEQLANQAAAEAVDLETLGKDSDFSVFMKDGVSPLLRKQAMAALWRSDPVFANVDGLVDYGEDFANPDLVMKTFTSAYQAGRGYLKVLEEQAKTLAAQEASEVGDDADQAATDQPLAAGDGVDDDQAPDHDLADDLDDAAPQATDLAPAEPMDDDASAEPDMVKVPLRTRLGLDQG